MARCFGDCSRKQTRYSVSFWDRRPYLFPVSRMICVPVDPGCLGTLAIRECFPAGGLEVKVFVKDKEYGATVSEITFFF